MHIVSPFLITALIVSNSFGWQVAIYERTSNIACTPKEGSGIRLLEGTEDDCKVFGKDLGLTWCGHYTFSSNTWHGPAGCTDGPLVVKSANWVDIAHEGFTCQFYRSDDCSGRPVENLTINAGFTPLTSCLG
ncbi:hypothetical protein AAE478_008684 [Parahypoxylon ruwenzoriense]